MVRKLPVLIAVGLLTLTPVAPSYGLGFGNIKLNSALNEPFNAEIDLLSATVDETTGLTIKLASREAFMRSGIDRPTFLNGLKFEIKSRTDDTFYIKLSSSQAIREPFLNFLLELNWYNGRILREYTVLLDPPGRVIKQPSVVATPVVKEPVLVVSQPETIPEVTPEPAAIEPEPEPALEPELAVAEEVPVEEMPVEVEASDEMVAPVVELEPVAAPEAALEPETIQEPEVIVPEEMEIAEVEPEMVNAPELAAEAEPEMAKAMDAEAVVTEEIPAEEMLDVEEQELSKPIKSGLAAILAKANQKASAEGEVDTLDEVALPDAAEPIVEPEMAVPSDMDSSIEASSLAMSLEDEGDVFVDDGELFPRIPLTEYSEDGVLVEVQELGDYDYGISQKGDNLWTVAKKLQRDDSVSIYQIMMALLKSNPGAFVNGNVHRLKVGQVLRIDDPDLLAVMSDSDARSAYQAQTGEWAAYQQELSATSVADADMAYDSQQPIIAGDMETVEATEDEPTGELTVAAPEGEQTAAGEGLAEDSVVNNEIAALQDELRQLRADTEAMGGQDAALNQHIAGLEAEIAMMQRAISIEDSGLATMQQQLAESNNNEPELAPAEEVVSQPIEETTEMAEPVAETAPGTMLADELAKVEVVTVLETPEEPVKAPTDDATIFENEELGQHQLDGDMNNQIVLSELPVQSTPSNVPEQATGIMATISAVFASSAAVLTGLVGDPLLLFIGLPVLLVLIILMIIVMRRRKKAQSNFEESILSGEPASMPASEANDGESSFLSDFAVSGSSAIQAEDSEVDPLTEADVFMAYGRYEAAEERLSEAMESNPERKEFKLKLLEVYNATQNQTAFESLAEDLYASLGENASSEPMWDKVVTMGKDLAPNNPLFTGAVVAPSLDTTPDDPGVNLSDSQVMDIGLDTGMFQADDMTAKVEESSDLDFNLDLGDSSTKDEKDNSGTEELAESTSGMDFDLNLADSDNENPTAELDMPAENDFNLGLPDEVDDLAGLDMKNSTDSATLEADMGGLDFDMDVTDSTVATESNQDETLESDISSMDFDLGLGNAGNDSSTEDSDNATMIMDTNAGSDLSVNSEDDTSVDLNLDTAADLSFSLDEVDDTNDSTMAIDLGKEPGSDPLQQDETATDLALDMSNMGEAEDLADLDLAAGGDEVGTKLDLARAYIDMGDPEGARSILDEVLDEGDENQKQEAQQLIQQIA